MILLIISVRFNFPIQSENQSLILSQLQQDTIIMEQDETTTFGKALIHDAYPGN